MKLHLGSGDVRLDGWLNVDLNAANADLHLDLRGKLPFEDESIEYIFSEHFIEHIPREDALSFLKECRRVLKRNGVLRLSTPNLKFLVLSYLSCNIGEWEDWWQPANPCRLMNEGMRFWGHEFLYDAEELIESLREAGFKSAKFFDWGKSDFDELSELETRPFHNELIVEALKNSDIGFPQNIQTSLEKNTSWLNTVRNEVVASQAGKIQSMRQELATRDLHIASLEQTITDQANHIHNVEAELTEFHSSWLGKLYLIIKKIHRLLKFK